MRTTIYKLVEAVGRAADLPQPIYEFGACRVPGQEGRGNLKDCFPGKQLITSDATAGPGVDRVLDLHYLDLPNATIGAAILLDTIEHVEKPWQALQEIHRALKPGGIVVMTSVMYFPIHPYPDDYWRFTASGFRSLLAPFQDTLLASCGLKTLPHTVVGIGFKSPVSAPLKSQLTEVLGTWSRSGARSWKEIVLAILPPFLLVPAYRWYVTASARGQRNDRRSRAANP